MMISKNIRSIFIAVVILRLMGDNINSFGQELDNIKDEKLADFHGAIGASAYFYAVNGIEQRRVPFSWLINGQTQLTIKGIELPLSFQVSEQNRSFRQPFNQFGLSPKYKWATLHLGWRNMSFSRYTLDGHTFLGGGVEFNPRKLRFAAMYGRLLKAVAEDTTKQIYNSISQYPYAMYTRKGYAVKLGFGSEKNFFDLIYFKGKDDINSLADVPVYQMIQPGENATAGIKSKFTFLKKKLVFDIDAAASVYTRNTQADSIVVEDKTLAKIAKKTLIPRLSTNVFYAGDVGLEYREERFGLALKYSRVTPDYQSMGIYYVQTDVERYTFAPYYNNKTNSLLTNASLGFENDDLLRKKLARTSRLIGSINISYNPKPEYGFTLQYSNFGITQRPGLRSINDTVVLNQVTQNLTIVPRYTLQKENAIHTFTYLFSDQVLNDRNKFQSYAFDMTSINNTLSYVVYLMKSTVTIDLSAFYITTKISSGDAVSIGGAGGIAKSFFKNTVNSSLNATYSTNSFDGAPDGNTLQFRTTHQYKLDKHQNFKADIVYTNNNSKSQLVNKSFNEWLTTLTYNYTF